MVMVCFVLDLRSLSPSLLRDLKQSLLQLANFYSVLDSTSEKPKLKPLSDRIGLCYIVTDRISSSNQLKVAYAPSGNFSLRKFHHAVNSLPSDAFSPKTNDVGAVCASDLKLASILSNKVLYSWGGHEKDIAKVIVISSCVVEDLDSVKKDILMDAADKCVSIEFLLLEQQSSHLGYLSENISNFVKHISDLENCSFHAYLPDQQVLGGLVKRWLQDLKDDMDEAVQARIIFMHNIFGTMDLISCALSASATPITDGFSPCQMCRCHGFPLNDSLNKQTNRSFSCPVTGDDLETFNLVEDSVKVGEQTVLFLPSFENCVKLQRVSQPIDLNIIERTNLGSLSEGVLLGTSFNVIPSAFCESDDIDKSELNTQLFQGLCSALHSLDQGLVCSSKCNIETMMETLFHCYYILLPSEKGLMLLRRLAASEETLPFPDVSQLMSTSAPKEIENSVQASLQKMEVRDYNPFLHERGFHQKLNLLVKESLQFRSISPNLKEVTSEPDSFQYDCSEDPAPSNQTPNLFIIEEDIPQWDVKEGEDQASARITEEWEQLIVCGAPKISSPTFVSKPKLDQFVLSPQDGSRKINEKTSRILERLEVPRQLKIKAPLGKSSGTTNADLCAPMKAPLIPFQCVNSSDQGTASSQPMKPNFQRLKRKQR